MGSNGEDDGGREALSGLPSDWLSHDMLRRTGVVHTSLDGREGEGDD